MKKTVLREYARLIVRSGVNVQKGQEVLIYADLDQPEFVQMVVEEAYKAKAKKVTVEWNYQPLQKLHVRHQSVKTLGEVPEWQKARLQHYVDVIPCRIHLMSEDPDGLKGINMAKLAKSRQLRYPIVKPYSDQLENNDHWCIAAVPGVAWAKKVFPGMRTGTAMEKLWEAILFTSRVTDDPVKAWEEHNADLHDRCAYLNSLHIRSLHYTAENGISVYYESAVWPVCEMTEDATLGRALELASAQSSDDANYQVVLFQKGTKDTYEDFIGQSEKELKQAYGVISPRKVNLSIDGAAVTAVRCDIQAYYAVLATIEYDNGDVIYVSGLTKLASISDIVNLVESVSLS